MPCINYCTCSSRRSSVAPSRHLMESPPSQSLHSLPRAAPCPCHLPATPMRRHRSTLPRNLSMAWMQKLKEPYVIRLNNPVHPCWPVPGETHHGAGNQQNWLPLTKYQAVELQNLLIDHEEMRSITKHSKTHGNT